MAGYLSSSDVVYCPYIVDVSSLTATSRPGNRDEHRTGILCSFETAMLTRSRISLYTSLFYYHNLYCTRIHEITAKSNISL